MILPDGTYTVRSGNRHISLTAMPGATYRLDLRPGHVLDFRFAAQTSRSGEITIRLSAMGEGRHQFSLRPHNLDVDSPTQDLTLVSGKPAVLEWKAKMISKDGPWVIVAIADGDISSRRDLVGSAPALASGH